jgi:hypothetical protein
LKRACSRMKNTQAAQMNTRSICVPASSRRLKR